MCSRSPRLKPFPRPCSACTNFQLFAPITVTCGTDHDASAAGVGEVEVGALEPRHPRPDSDVRNTSAKKGVGSPNILLRTSSNLFVDPFLEVELEMRMLVWFAFDWRI